MAFTHQYGATWGAGASILGGVQTRTAAIEQNFSLALGTVTNQLIDLELAAAKLDSLFILASVACTLKTNSSGSPDDTIALAAGVPFVWFADSGVPYPFAGAVTAGYVTTTEATQLDIRTLSDL